MDTVKFVKVKYLKDEMRQSSRAAAAWICNQQVLHVVDDTWFSKRHPKFMHAVRQKAIPVTQ